MPIKIAPRSRATATEYAEHATGQRSPNAELRNPNLELGT